MNDLSDYTTEKVLSETKKLQYLCTLKQVIRYGRGRDGDHITESVAEHIYGMHIISQYFRRLEDPENALNMARVYELISWHDAGEIETGDIPAVRKTEEDRRKERELVGTVIERSPEIIQGFIRDCLAEYEHQETAEARFVKAIDKAEPLFQSYDPRCKSVQHELELTTKSSRDVKERYIASYPYIKRFCDVLHEVMDEEGYFHPSS